MRWKSLSTLRYKTAKYFSTKRWEKIKIEHRGTGIFPQDIFPQVLVAPEKAFVLIVLQSKRGEED